MRIDWLPFGTTCGTLQTDARRDALDHCGDLYADYASPMLRPNGSSSDAASLAAEQYMTEVYHISGR